MAAPRYTASKSLPKGRSSYVINFRHPLRRDAKTGQGLKIRRGLGTSDAVEADALVAEMNELLSNESFHSISMKSEAERKFSNVIANAFYDDLETPVDNNWDLRERYLPLPTAEDGYARVLFVGTTGAGKTSLLRHLIGSDPDKDRFPSTSTAKTTIADTEIVVADAPYQAVVTFFSEASVRTNIHECVVEACLKAKAELDKAITSDGEAEADDSKIVNSLLNHPAQRFRLGYTLGLWNPRITQAGSGDEWSDDEDEWNDDDSTAEDADALENEGVMPTLAEKAQMQATLEDYVKRIRQITVSALNELPEALGGIDLQEEDPDIIEELFGDIVRQRDDVSDLINDIMDEVQKRFDYLTGGTLRKRGSGWPEVWTYENEDRDEFIAKVRLLSSNFAKYFGRLLTPIVEGVRVRGPFAPVFADTDRKLVFMDGQGLGHTPDSASSVTTHITERFKDVDLILLVDNAKQPMQAAPLSVIRSVAASGYQKKLAIAFTHFDQVKGANLPGFGEKKDHVLASLVNGLNSLSDALGNKTVRAIERNLDQRCFMIGGLDRSLQAAVSKKRQTNRDELERLLDYCQDAIDEGLYVEARPIYDPAFLMYALQSATNDFRQRWDALLGLGKLDGVSKEHWTRIWALNRRMAEQIDIEYDSLRPVADLLARLNEGTTTFLSKPADWTKLPKNDEEEDAVIDAIKQSVDLELRKLSQFRIADEPLKRWQGAFKHSGRGSTFKRAEDIQMLYGVAAPELGTVMTEVAREFLNEVRQIVYTAIEENGGKIVAEAAVVSR
jgi:energy-coupling factor transporter ATP-binding protein EcfA2